VSKVPIESSNTNPWLLTTARIVAAGVLAAITIILLAVIPGLGFIPVPNISGRATIEHIPTILGGVLEGPVVGMVTGLVFGLVTFFFVPLTIKDPIVIILPRIFIGLTAWLTFIALRRLNRDVAAALAGFIGAATNTVLVIGLAIARGYVPFAVIPIILPQAIAEAIIAAILTVIITRAVYIVRGRFVRAPETKSRDELPY
jgi:uncharacterized membrane protein